MLRENHIKEKGRQWVSWVAASIGVALLGFFGVEIVRQQPNLTALRQELKGIDLQINEVREKQAELDRQKEYYQTAGYLEQQARLKLNYKKPGEQVVYVYHPSTSSGPSASPLLATRQSNLRQWWNYLVRD